MAKYLIQDTTLAGMSDEIRTLYGTEETMTPAVMTENLSNANTEVDAQTELIQQILELLGLKTVLIAFTIDGTEYQAEEGMTWGEWVESEYNTGGFSVNATGDVKFEYYVLEPADGSMIMGGLSNTTIENGSSWIINRDNG